MDDHLTPAALKERGWTPAMIRTLLGPPDALRPNPVFRSAAPMRLYDGERVRQAESSDRFTALRTSADRRSRSALNASARRRAQTMAQIEDVPMTVPLLAWETLAAKAVSHRNRRDGERALERTDHLPTPATVSQVDEVTLQRWMVNYLRHELTRYDEATDQLFGKVGRSAAADRLRARVYAAIARTYPALTPECERQRTQRRAPPSGESTG
ncbi:hypothetical protein ACFXJ8_30620 [Nonomuraea sp. NPDC059194]|uniref:hypothetical protein n=1 Tax=Nonomuraea sp. NPDC059194 TaxID=3346764 RepID=UPI0036968116